MTKKDRILTFSTKKSPSLAKAEEETNPKNRVTSFCTALSLPNFVVECKYPNKCIQVLNAERIRRCSVYKKHLFGSCLRGRLQAVIQHTNLTQVAFGNINLMVAFIIVGCYRF
jgi:hypothetical protein